MIAFDNGPKIRLCHYETLAEDHARKELVPEEEASQFADSVEKEIKAAGQS